MSETITSQLYAAVSEALERGWSINLIAQSAGVHQSSLHNWYSGRRQSLSLETASLLCSHFGMKLTKPKIERPAHESGESREPRRKPKAKQSGKKSASKPAKGKKGT